MKNIQFYCFIAVKISFWISKDFFFLPPFAPPPSFLFCFIFSFVFCNLLEWLRFPFSQISFYYFFLVWKYFNLLVFVYFNIHIQYVKVWINQPLCLIRILNFCLSKFDSQPAVWTVWELVRNGKSRPPPDLLKQTAFCHIPSMTWVHIKGWEALP